MIISDDVIEGHYSDDKQCVYAPTIGLSCERSDGMSILTGVGLSLAFTMLVEDGGAWTFL